jgi:hypothetical protein
VLCAVKGREFDGFFSFERMILGLNGKRLESL